MGNLFRATEFFRRQLDSASIKHERVKLLLAPTALLVLLSALFSLRELTVQAGQSLVTSEDNLSRLKNEAADDVWPRRLETTRALKAQLVARLWNAPTSGLAEAGFEAWIRSSFDRHGGKPQLIQIIRSSAIAREGQTATSVASLQRMTAKVLAPFDPQVLWQVLADAANADRTIIVDRLIVRAGPNARIEMDLSTFDQTGDAQLDGKVRP